MMRYYISFYTKKIESVMKTRVKHKIFFLNLYTVAISIKRKNFKLRLLFKNYLLVEALSLS